MTSPHRIALDGEYDLARKDEIEGLFDSVDGDGAVVIDCSNVTYLDSTFLKELAKLRRRSSDRPISLTGVNDNIRRVLEIVGFARLFDIVE